MKKLTKRVENINSRFQFANAERRMYEVGSEKYKELTEIINMILKEYENKFSCRHSFRLIGNRYNLVVLSNCESF